MQRGSNGSENLAEAVAKLCGELDHIAQVPSGVSCLVVASLVVEVHSCGLPKQQIGLPFR